MEHPSDVRGSTAGRGDSGQESPLRKNHARTGLGQAVRCSLIKTRGVMWSAVLSGELIKKKKQEKKKFRRRVHTEAQTDRQKESRQRGLNPV